MSIRTLSNPRPSNGRNVDWENKTGIKTGHIALSEPALTTMPFVRPSRNDASGPVRFEWTAVGRDGELHNFFQVFRPGDNTSLPGPTAGRVVLALLSMSPGQVGDNLEIQTNISQIARLCRLSPSGRTYQQLRRALIRLLDLSIETNAFWDYGKKEYIDESRINLLSHYYINKEPEQKSLRVGWAPTVTRLMNTWTKPLNINHVLELPSCLSRKLYQVSSLGIYQEGEMVEDLDILCHGHLGISQSRTYPSDMKSSMKKPAETLRDNRLVDVQIEKSESPEIQSGWLVRARPMERMRETYSEIGDPQYWASHLARRGLMDLKDNPVEECRELVDHYGAEKVRQAVQEYDRRRSGESNEQAPKHAGWIKSVLEQGMSFEDRKLGRREEAPAWLT